MEHKVMVRSSTKLILYGLQRSGTNYLEQLLNRTYRVKYLNSNKDTKVPLQKHFRMYDEKNIVGHEVYLNSLMFNNYSELHDWFRIKPDAFIVISKDPYSWLLSYRKWAEKNAWPKVQHHHIEEYNLFYGKFLSLAKESDNIHFVRYQDLLCNMDGELARLQQLCGFAPRKSLFRNTNLRRVPQSARFTQDRLDYYVKEHYMDQFTETDLAETNALLSTEVMRSLGYERRGK